TITIRAGLEGDGTLHKAADMRLQRLDIPGEHRLLDAVDHALERDVDAIDLDAGWLFVEQRMQLALVELVDGFIWREEIAIGKDAAIPAIDRVVGHLYRAIGNRFVLIVDFGPVVSGDGATPLTGGAHTAEHAEIGLLGDGFVASLHGDS